MDIGSLSGASSSPSNLAQVKVFNKASDNLEAVVGKIFQGVEEVQKNVVAASKGHRVNIVA